MTIDGLIDQLIDWLIDWLIDGRVVKVLNPAETHTVVLSAEETGIFIKLEKGKCTF